MIIEYCERCGQRISDDEINSGTARKDPDGKVVCGKCFTVAVQAVTSSAGVGRGTPSVVNRLPGNAGPSYVTPHAHLRSTGRAGRKPAASNTTLYVGGAIAAGLIVALVAASAKSTAPESSSVPAATTPAGNASSKTLSDNSGTRLTQPVVSDDPRARLALERLSKAKALMAGANPDMQAARVLLNEIILEYHGNVYAEEASRMLREMSQRSPPGESKSEAKTEFRIDSETPQTFAEARSDFETPMYNVAGGHFELMDAGKFKPVSGVNPLRDGAKLCLSKLPKKLSIRYINEGTLPGSVQLEFQGQTRIENSKPFDLFGDNKGNSHPGDLKPGKSKLIAKTYEEIGAKGKLLHRTCITLNIE
jgi:hypothetical protein